MDNPQESTNPQDTTNPTPGSENDPSVAPAVVPPDDPAYDDDPEPTASDSPFTTDDDGSPLDKLRAAAANLASSEVPNSNELPGIIGVLVFHAEHGELPAPVEDRFSDDNNNN